MVLNWGEGAHCADMLNTGIRYSNYVGVRSPELLINWREQHSPCTLRPLNQAHACEPSDIACIGQYPSDYRCPTEQGHFGPYMAILLSFHNLFNVSQCGEFTTIVQ